ncbi:accessory Sec system S-layer assembly protein [Caldifermentibacillus hisashii]|uniref:accessory Sec system S-layer assembly protein n=1 Tax=Caldifermentibacillus hisashii TaxID=996558 RepID=UPI003D1D6367
MFKFLSKNTQENMKKTGLDNTIESGAILNDEEREEQNSNRDIHTKIFYHPSWNIGSEQRYVLNFLNNDLPPLKPYQLSLSGIELTKIPNALIVTAFIRNSLPKAINLQELPLILLDENQEIIAQHVFDGNQLGEIPAESSMPWNFTFPKETIKKDAFSTENWTLAFNLAYTKHYLDLDESWEKALPQEEIERLQKIVEQLPKLKENELNLTGLQANIADNGDLHITVLIRNGSDKNMNLEKIPLRVVDATGDIIAEGGFSLNNFTVKANTTKPWTFIFPDSLIKKENIDLSRWSVSVIQ